MKRGWLVLTLLLSLGVNLGLVGVGLARRAGLERWERVREGAAPPPVGFADRLAERLGVPEARRERFVAIQRQLVERTAGERRAVARARFELRRELLEATPDPARIDTLLTEIAAREAELNRAFVDGVLASREVLDADELERYLRVLDRAAPGRGRGFREGPPRRSPPPP